MAIFGKKTKDDLKKKSAGTDGTPKSIKVSEKKPKDAELETDAKSMKDLYENAPTTKSILPSKDQKREVRHGNAFRILDRPVITEKATALIAGNKYVFAVAGDANKIEISKAIEEVYGIRPTDVNIIKMRGKTVTRGRYKGKRKNWKKAIVTLPKGKTIEVYEGV